MKRTVSSPIGPITLEEKEGKLVGLEFGGEIHHDFSSLLYEGEKELREYFSGKRKEFSIPIAPEGTEFQQRVWEALLSIPYGETRTYGDIARAIGNPKAVRAVGGANRRNPISIIVPCHRVIGADGSLTGYGGGLDKKIFLLNLEKEYSKSVDV